MGAQGKKSAIFIFQQLTNIETPWLRNMTVINVHLQREIITLDQVQGEGVRDCLVVVGQLLPTQ